MVYTGGDYIYSADGGTSWTTITDYDLWFEEYGDAYTAAASGEPIAAPPREFYISGYLPRYQKRQIIGYHAASGDLRSIEVNASGHLFTDIAESGIGVQIQSGAHVQISGQHVFVESGAFVTTQPSIAVSGTVSVQSGVVDVLEYGYHILSGEWRPKAVCDSGEIVVCSGVGVLVSGQQTARSGHGALYPFNPEIDNSAIVLSGTYETNINLLYAYDSETSDEWERLKQDGTGSLYVKFVVPPVVIVASGIINSHLYGYHPASGLWVPLAVTLSGCLAMTYCSSGGLF